jgi:hypothetical protein
VLLRELFLYQQLLILAIAESKTFTIASGTASATGTINDNAAPTVATITPASATEGVLLCLNSA